jgi:hypothetical protein
MEVGQVAMGRKAEREILLKSQCLDLDSQTADHTPPVITKPERQPDPRASCLLEPPPVGNFPDSKESAGRMPVGSGAAFRQIPRIL